MSQKSKNRSVELRQEAVDKLLTANIKRSLEAKLLNPQKCEFDNLLRTGTVVEANSEKITDTLLV